MEEFKKFKAWYFDSHDEIIAEEVITGSPECDIHLARLLASNIADSHYPECIKIECLELGKEKTSVREH